MVAIVLSTESTIWRKASVRELKYIDVEDMRVVTNDKHIAEQIKSGSNLLHNKVENVVMNGSKVGKFGRQQILKSIVMNGPKVGEFGKVEREQNLKSVVVNGVKSKRGDMVKSVAMNGVKSGKLGKLRK